jgi:DNA repair protein RadC
MKTRPYRSAVREMPEEDRPRERLVKLGPEALRDAELLAVLFRTGTREEGAVAVAERVLRHFGNLRGLSRASVEQLTEVKGLGTVKAIEIKAALELGRRLAEFQERHRPKIRCADDVSRLLMIKYKDCEVEQFKVLLLNTKNEVARTVDVSHGTADRALALPRDVFRQAVREGATSIIACHNHPSGDPEPSQDDIQLTHRLKESGETLGIQLVDHIIFGDGRIVSLKERGLI